MNIPNNDVQFDLRVEITYINLQNCEMTLEFLDEKNPLTKTMIKTG